MLHVPQDGLLLSFLLAVGFLPSFHILNTLTTNRSTGIFKFLKHKLFFSVTTDVAMVVYTPLVRLPRQALMGVYNQSNEP